MNQFKTTQVNQVNQPNQMHQQHQLNRLNRLNRRSFLAHSALGLAGAAGAALFLSDCGSGGGSSAYGNSGSGSGQGENPAPSPTPSPAPNPAGNCLENGTPLETTGTTDFHTHTIQLSAADIAASDPTTVFITSDVGHTHPVQLTADQYTTLKANQAVSLSTGPGGGDNHTHSLRFTCA